MRHTSRIRMSLTPLRNGLKKVFRWINNKKVIYSFISSLLLIIISYLANNAPLFTGESMTKYYIIQNLCEKIGIHKTVNYGDATFYNVAYDKMIIPATRNESRKDTLGVSVITDREKLLRFLKLLEKTDKYKYILLDLTFEKKDVSIYDDSLYHQISKMRDIVVATHSEINFADSSLVESGKTGLASYFTTKVTTNFGRFEYSQNDQKSLPLTVYENLNPGRRLKRFGVGRLSFYTIGRKLCQNACFLTFDDKFLEPSTQELKNKQSAQLDKYINLGSFINDPSYDESLLVDIINNTTAEKYVVIGDFNADIHDTYMGAIPGSIIMTRALATLEEGGNLVYALQIIIWFLAFFLISLSICHDIPLSKRLPRLRNVKYKWIHFLFSIVSFSLVLIVLSTVEYIFGYPVSSLVIPLFYFSLLKMYVQYKNYA